MTPKPLSEPKGVRLGSIPYIVDIVFKRGFFDF